MARIVRPPSAEQMLAVARPYLPEAARSFVKAELQTPSAELVMFTVRSDRWLTADFSEKDER